MWRGEDIYRFEEGFAYPPCKALIMIPFLALPPLVQRVAWWGCNALFFVLLLRAAWWLTGGKPIEGQRPFQKQEHLIWLLGLATGLFYVFNSLSNQATDILEACLLIAGCLCLSKARDLRAATYFGLAAAMKCTPLLWTAYLIWKRKWTAAAWLTIVAIGVNFLPDLIRPCPTASTWVVAWYREYLSPMQQADYTPGTWGSAVYYNQSLAGAVNRWLVSDWTWKNDDLVLSARKETLSAGTLKYGLLGLEALILVGCALLCWPKARDEFDQTGAILEYSTVLILMLLFSPMSSKSHFSTLLVPGFALARIIRERRSLGLGSLFLLANVIGFCALNWCGKYVALVSLYYGAVSLKALLLLGGCALALRWKKPVAIGTTAVQPENYGPYRRAA
jgi:hypothetical protein